MSVVVTPRAREMFTSRELYDAYNDFTKRESQSLHSMGGLTAKAYRLGERVLIVSKDLDTGLVVLAPPPDGLAVS